MRLLLMCSATALLIAMSGTAPAQNPGAGKDPDAIAALDRMGSALRKLQNFALHADVTRDEVLTTGQKLQFVGTVEIKARRPDGLRMDIKSDETERTFYYDGKNATLVSPRIGYYATFAAPPTIAETLKIASDRYGIETPMADLFAWGSDPAAVAKVQSAFMVGTETIRGQACDHYAMRQEGSDWEVWIRQGADALPCKLVITTTDDPSMPEFSAVYDWNPQQSFAASDFTFSPPANARKIAFGVIPAGSPAQ
jgi:hypothetical protein